MKLVDSKVWLRDGAGNIHGWDLEDINRKIDEFNSFPWAPEADFFQWLMMEMIIRDFLFTGILNL